MMKKHQEEVHSCLRCEYSTIGGLHIPQGKIGKVQTLNVKNLCLNLLDGTKDRNLRLYAEEVRALSP